MVIVNIPEDNDREIVANLASKFCKENKIECTDTYKVIISIANIPENNDRETVVNLASEFCKENKIDSFHMGNVIRTIANIPKDKDRETAVTLASEHYKKLANNPYTGNWPDRRRVEVVQSMLLLGKIDDKIVIDLGKDESEHNDMFLNYLIEYMANIPTHDRMSVLNKAKEKWDNLKKGVTWGNVDCFIPKIIKDAHDEIEEIKAQRVMNKYYTTENWLEMLEFLLKY